MTAAPYLWQPGPVTTLDDEQLRTLLVDTIRDAANNDARSLQTAMGPSEMGVACDRRLLYRLLEVAQVNHPDPHASVLGRAVHAWLADAFTQANRGKTPPEWLIEQTLDVMEWLDGSLSGSGDLFHVPTRTVLDWKLLGPSSYHEIHMGRPSVEYVTQLQGYGVGFLRRGLAPLSVGVVAIPRSAVNKRPARLDDIRMWRAPFDPLYAGKAIARVGELRGRAKTFGLEVLGEATTADSHCNWCPWFKAGATDLTVACPGHNPPTVDATADPFPFKETA
jgi:hypothetical protein